MKENNYLTNQIVNYSENKRIFLDSIGEVVNDIKSDLIKEKLKIQLNR